MPVAIEWLVKDRIILSTLEGQVSSADIEKWLDKQLMMVALGMPRVHHMSDSRRLENLIMGDNQALWNIMDMLPRSRDFGWHVEVSTNSYNQTTSLLRHFASVEMLSYPTITDGLKSLCEHDETLPALISQAA